MGTQPANEAKRQAKETRHREVLGLYASGMSMGEVSRETGISIQTISRWLTKAGVEIDLSRGGRPRGPLSEEHKAAISASKTGVSVPKPARRASWRDEERVCRCGTKFFPHAAKQTSCSNECRLKQLSERNGEKYIARLCPCGTDPRIKGRSVMALYCSDECHEQYAKKRQRDETNYITFDCQTCGNPVERYKGYGSGALKFCSNECAAKHTARRQHIVINETDEVLDSAYEAFVWGALRIAKVPVERFDRAGNIEWSPGHWYGPDFWLPRQGMAIECKGLENPEDKARWDAYRAQRGPLLVLTRDDLMDLSPQLLRSMVGWQS